MFFAFSVTVFLPASCTGVFYQPQKLMFYDPADFDYQYEDVDFKSVDGTPLHGWFFPVKNGVTELGTVLQFHGNAENITSHFRSLAWITKEGYNLFIFDYQGYGLSGGRPTQKRLNGDALAALDYAVIKNRERSEKSGKKLEFIAYGQSLGGAILMRALYDFKDKDKLDAVVIESSFSSYRRIAMEKLALSRVTWIFQPLAYLLVSDSYAPEDKIKTISPVPILVIHGDADVIVPVHHGEKIYSLAGQPKTFWEVPNGRHIDSMRKHGGKYRQNLIEYLASL